MNSPREYHHHSAAQRSHFPRRIHPAKSIRFARPIVAGCLALLSALLPAPITRALSDSVLDFYNANGIYYYDPSGSLIDCTTHTDGSNVTIIGDSITVGSEEAILALLPQADIHAQVSKQFGSAGDEPLSSEIEAANPSGISILKYLLAENQVRPLLVFALGTNNTPLTQDQIDALLDLAGSDYQIFLMTSYESSGERDQYYAINNQLVNQAAQNSNVHVIDWAEAASSDPALYIADVHIHPTAAGQELFAELISEAVGGTGNTSSGFNGDYTNYAGDSVLSDAQIALLESNISVYEQAIQSTGASSYGVTWQLLASVHYKETGLSRYNPANGQGVYQMYSYVNNTGNTFPPADSIDEAEFLRQTELVLTEFIIPTLESNGLDLSSDDDVKRFFFIYNGQAQQYIDKALAMGYTQAQAENGEGSPYVMNRYDAPRDPANPDGMDPNWPGGYVADGVYDATATSMTFGAYTVYSALGSSSVCVDGTVSSGGLTLEQARALMNDYIYNVNCTDYSITCDHGSSSGQKGNCVTFVQYFLARFTSASGIASTGNGGWVVSNLTGTDVASPFGTYRHTLNYSSHGFVYGGFTPKPFAVFSTGYSTINCGSLPCGHTGVVLGIDQASDTIYIGQAGYDTPLVGYSDVITYSLSEYTSGNYWYAYTDNIINTAALSSAIGGS